MSYYTLRAQGAHGQDTRWVATACVPSPSTASAPMIATASRDRTAALWSLPATVVADSSDVDLSTVRTLNGATTTALVSSAVTLPQHTSCTGHGHFVNFAYYVPASCKALQVLGAGPLPTEGGEPNQVSAYGSIITGCQDGTVGIWDAATGSLLATLIGMHTKAIKCGVMVPSAGWLPGSHHASGQSPFEAVTEEDAVNLDYLVTGSWDHTLVVTQLPSGKKVFVVQQHSESVLCCAWIPSNPSLRSQGGGGGISWGEPKPAAAVTTNGPTSNKVDMLSAGGDKVIVRWGLENNGDTIMTYHAQGHHDTIQALVVLDAHSFVSAGNDATIIWWDADTGAVRKRIGGHHGFIYGLAAVRSIGGSSSVEVLSCSEDRSVRVWDVETATCLQCIVHHAPVWSVAAVVEPTGHSVRVNIATGSADGTVSVWTRDSEVWAPMAVRSAFDQYVGSTLVDKRQLPPEIIAGLAKKSVGGVGAVIREVHELPCSGDYEGQTVVAMNRSIPAEGSTVIEQLEAYSWCAGGWLKVGMIAPDDTGNGGGATGGGGAPKGRHRREVNGVVYDYVFDVELQGNQLMLCYNAGQSVFDAAQQFVNENGHLGVSQADKELIQTHIMNNIDPADLALVGGGVGNGGGGANAGGAPSAPAFSKFAQEEEERKRQGLGPTKSYQDRLKELQSGGGSDEVAFSAYAKEGAARAAGLNPATATAGPSENLSNFIITKPEYFAAVPLGPVSNKLKTFDAVAGMVDHVVGSVDAVIQALSPSSGSVPQHVLHLVHTSAALIGHQLSLQPPTQGGRLQRLPPAPFNFALIDLLRALSDVAPNIMWTIAAIDQPSFISRAALQSSYWVSPSGDAAAEAQRGPGVIGIESWLLRLCVSVLNDSDDDLSAAVVFRILSNTLVSPSLLTDIRLMVLFALLGNVSEQSGSGLSWLSSASVWGRLWKPTCPAPLKSAALMFLSNATWLLTRSSFLLSPTMPPTAATTAMMMTRAGAIGEALLHSEVGTMHEGMIPQYQALSQQHVGEFTELALSCVLSSLLRILNDGIFLETDHTHSILLLRCVFSLWPHPSQSKAVNEELVQLGAVAGCGGDGIVGIIVGSLVQQGIEASNAKTPVPAVVKLHASVQSRKDFGHPDVMKLALYLHTAFHQVA